MGTRCPHDARVRNSRWDTSGPHLLDDWACKHGVGEIVILEGTVLMIFSHVTFHLVQIFKVLM